MAAVARTEQMIENILAAGDVATVVSPGGRRQVPLDLLVDLAEEVRREPAVRHPLAQVLRNRREAALHVDAQVVDLSGAASPAGGHEAIERRSRDELEHIIRAAAEVSGDMDLVVIGSQAILGSYDRPPPCCCPAMRTYIRAITRSAQS